MAIPWTGFPPREPVDYARPLSSAKYAAHDLAFIATGA
jgi:hypothetical protein